MGKQGDGPLERTPLFELHRELGAKMVPFAGYQMPLWYPAGILAEHRHTRAAASLFDVSHMGQVRLNGGDPAAAFVPDDVIFVDELPHTATGKVSKATLRARFKDYRLPTA